MLAVRIALPSRPRSGIMIEERDPVRRLSLVGVEEMETDSLVRRSVRSNAPSQVRH